MKKVNLFQIRHWTNECLHMPTSRVARVVNGLLILLIVISIAVLPLHFLPNLEWASPTLDVFNKVVVTIFTIEYILRIWSAQKPFRYIFSRWGLIDLLAILPFYLGQIGIITTPELFFSLRIFRILKLGKIYDLERTAILQCANDHHGEFRVIEGEKIERVVRKHPLVFLLSLFLPLILVTTSLTILVFFQAHLWAILASLPFFFLGSIFFLKAWLDFNYDVIYITNRRIILQDRELFGAISNDITYESITNVKPDNTGILHWILSFGDIQIETAAQEGALFFRDAPKPHDVVRHITQNRQIILAQKLHVTEKKNGGDTKKSAVNF